MKTALNAPSQELIELRDRKVSLLKRNASSVKEVEKLITEMGQFRTQHPQFAETIMKWEVELLDNFPGANPDGQQ
jgi:hemerythrin